AEKSFEERTRPSGDKYINHSLDVALSLQEKNFCTATVIGGLLHHIELNEKNLEYIEKNISADVVDMLKTYSEIDKAVKNTDASFTIATRYILNSVNDLRPAIIQVFNAQSNSHILDSIEDDEEKKSILQKNLNIYSNLAEYLGFDDLKTDITEEAFRITQKEDYEYVEKLYKKQGINENTLSKYESYLQKIISKFNGKTKIEGRIKSKYSTFNKLKKYIKEGYNDPINRITDLIGFRILTDTEKDCFNILDAIWDKGEIIIEEFDDYISHPKYNGYKAIQGPVVFPELGEKMIEVQILTQKMHNYNTYGPASHIAYKEGKSRYAKPSDKYIWVEQVHNAIIKNIEKSKEKFSVPIEVEIFPDEVYTLTPKGRLIELTKGDTVTDFAYLIHTDIGNSMVGAKVNNKSVSFDHKLETGDVVEIITQKGKTHPKPTLLMCANSPSTKSKIERAIK
ncbi:MAG: GTP pyrophosphokinase, partial [candidate division WS6 bacterium 34_10]